MAQEWFTLAELRSALPQFFGQQRCGLNRDKMLAAKFERMKPERARVRRPKPGDDLHDLEPEFHITALWYDERAALVKKFGPSIEHRIYKLGIHRPCAEYTAKAASSTKILETLG